MALPRPERVSAPNVPKSTARLGGRGTARHRFFDAQEHAWVIKVLHGEFYVTGEANEIVATVLGSCVSACIRDSETGFGGLNHFMLPEEKGSGWDGADAALRYGTFAMERLLNEVLRTGCPRERLEIKVFGGSILRGNQGGIGDMNARFVLHYLEQERLLAQVADLGGPKARRINYYPTDGRVRRKFVAEVEADLVKSEDKYKDEISQQVDGGIELFGSAPRNKGERR